MPSTGQQQARTSEVFRSLRQLAQRTHSSDISALDAAEQPCQPRTAIEAHEPISLQQLALVPILTTDAVQPG